MPPRYKDDWDEAKQRLVAWWAGDNIGRCGLWVTAPRDDAPDEQPPPEPTTPEGKWFDLDYWSALTEWRNARTFFGGEAFPTYARGYGGACTHPVFLGCEIDLDMQTGWVLPHPGLTGEALDCSALAIDEANPNLQFHLARLRRSAEEAPGKCIPGVGAFGGVGDTLAWLRGTQRLLLDLVDRPEAVAAAEMHLIDQWCRLYGRFHEITRDAAGGSTCWFGLWSPGKFYATQNDFAYMISPRAFEECFLPGLARQLAFLDHSVHHVDGVGNFAHVDLLCELADLDALQILPGAGKPSPLAYLPVLRKVQAAGKNLHISIGAEEVEAALANLSARGLFIATSCETEAQARRLLAAAEGWSKDRRVAGGMGV